MKPACLRDIRTAPLLTRDECSRVAEKVLGLRDHWKRRIWWAPKPDLPYISLGAAAYMDTTPVSSAAYFAGVKRSNPVLRRHLGWLYETLLEGLGRELGASASYHPRWALPGFHVLLAHPDFEFPNQEFHLDLQYLRLDRRSSRMYFGETLSFTVAIEMPRSGSGMNVVDVSCRDVIGLSPQEARRKVDRARKWHHSYRMGQLNLHSGHFFHQLAPVKRFCPGEVRITLQGHAILKRDRWWVYW